MAQRFSLVTGAGTQCYINGTLVGEVVSFDWNSNVNRRAIYGVDSAEPYELAAGATKVEGRITLLRRVGLGGLEGYGFASGFENAPRELYLTIELRSRQTRQPVFLCGNAVIKSQSWSVSAREIMKGQFTFEGIDWSNEIRTH